MLKQTGMCASGQLQSSLQKQRRIPGATCMAAAEQHVHQQPMLASDRDALHIFAGEVSSKVFAHLLVLIKMQPAELCIVPFPIQ